ncbi:MAG: response regulator, partial [Chloroflexaceae bacterium]
MTTPIAPTEHAGNILIVDDNRENLRLLAGVLSEHTYQVRPVTNGPRALAAAFDDPPDLIMLDIMMPEMDGYAVCQAFKADERTADISIIFISALNEVFDKVKAFQVGGVDYSTKPFQVEEVLARVQTHLKLRALQQQLERQNGQLAQEIADRKRVEQQLHDELAIPREVQQSLLPPAH